MTIYEITGTITGVAGVWLAARENIWTWPMGMLSTLMLIYVCYDARLYADVGLNTFYFFTSGYGWYAWLHHPANQRADLPVTRTRPVQWWWLGIFAGAFTLALGYFLTHFTNADLSYPDSATTGISLAAYWMMARKKLENWLVWLFVDSVYVGIYLYKDLYLLAGLYTVFLVLATDGYFKWRRAAQVAQLA